MKATAIITLIIMLIITGCSKEENPPSEPQVQHNKGKFVYNNREIKRCVLWLSADSSISFNDSGYVAVWNDLSGNKNNGVPKAGFYPNYQSNALNGRSIVKFEGKYSISLTNPISQQEATIFIVVRPYQLNDKNYLAFSDNSWYFRYAFNHLQLRLGHHGGHSHFLNEEGTEGAWRIYSILKSNASINLFKDKQKSKLYDADYTTEHYSAPKTLNIKSWGDERGSNDSFNGDIAEIIMFEYSLSDNDRIFIEEYLAAKYNL